MLKLLRSVFSTVGVLVREDDQQLMWKYIEELHKLQEKEASWQQAKNGPHPVEKSENEEFESSGRQSKDGAPQLHGDLRVREGNASPLQRDQPQPPR
ncbi:hypothetical protein KUCAC02_032237 [Chaenocephalus aceratus]|nr:hypothetical protein KUCAC02_032237 [Chaenocephalus aceratus]